MTSLNNPTFNDLTNEEQSFVRDRKITDTKTIDEWLSYFTPLALFDKRGDKLRRNGNYIKAFWAFWIVFGLYMSFIFMFSKG